MQIVRITLVCLLAWIAAGCAPEPKDKDLIKNFQDHREEFEALRAMIIHDKGLRRVDDNWTDPADPMSVGVTPERIAEYRAIFRKLGIPRGFSSEPRSIDLLVHTEGISIAGSSKGYAWRRLPPAETEPSLDKPQKKGSEEAESHPVGYRRIEGDWYLYFEGS